MQATGMFAVTEFTPTDYVSPVATGLAVGHALMVKEYTGQVEGRSITQFSHAFSQERGIGTYVAMEAFEGSLDGRTGTFNFAHSATTLGGAERFSELFVIVPESGTGELTGITGGGALRIDEDGTHHMDFDYDLPGSA
jgi:hypothetical protein